MHIFSLMYSRMHFLALHSSTLHTGEEEELYWARVEELKAHKKTKTATNQNHDSTHKQHSESQRNRLFAQQRNAHHTNTSTTQKNTVQAQQTAHTVPSTTTAPDSTSKSAEAPKGINR